MKSSFWKTLPKSFFALAPMEDVTDTVFRLLIAEISSSEFLNLFMTEFISADGLCHSTAKTKIIHRLYVCEQEKKILKKKKIGIVAQIWGNNPENYFTAVKNLTEEFSFDGVDINMGCPVGKVVKKGCCSALIDNPNLAKELIFAAQEATHLPISVKTRIGVKDVVTQRWAANLLSIDNLAAISIHGRTQKQQSKGLADWGEIGKVVQLRNQLNKETLILGNGDVQSITDAKGKIEESGVDGVLIGRGIFQNPWLFNEVDVVVNDEERLKLLWHHCVIFDKIWQEEKSFNILKRFFKIYISNFPYSSRLRNQLMLTKSLVEIEVILKNYITL